MLQAVARAHTHSHATKARFAHLDKFLVVDGTAAVGVELKEKEVELGVVEVEIEAFLERLRHVALANEARVLAVELGEEARHSRAVLLEHCCNVHEQVVQPPHVHILNKARKMDNRQIGVHLNSEGASVPHEAPRRRWCESNHDVQRRSAVN